MGLDMYLNASRYLSNYDDADMEKKAEMLKLFPELEVYLTEEVSPIRTVVAEIGYWRKANQIHKWFVDNVQEGVDDCKSYYVDRDQLNELKSLCERVLANHDLAGELLPTGAGFFFGSTEYGEYYFQDLEETIKIIDKALVLSYDWDLAYQSSW